MLRILSNFDMDSRLVGPFEPRLSGQVSLPTRSIVKIREELILKALAGEETKVELAANTA
jgi:hypothetical protein